MAYIQQIILSRRIDDPAVGAKGAYFTDLAQRLSALTRALAVSDGVEEFQVTGLDVWALHQKDGEEVRSYDGE